VATNNTPNEEKKSSRSRGTEEVGTFQYLIQCYGTGDLRYGKVINKFKEKYPKTTISHVAIRKLVKICGNWSQSKC
jgi:hypothetical protein